MNSLSHERAILYSKLRQQADRFENRNRLQKLVSSPYRFLLSEAAVRLQTVVLTETQTFWGEGIRITLPEPVSTFLYRYGYFEEGLTAFFIAVLREGDCFIDVGSHYGYFSLLARHLVGARGQVVAFEPTPSTYEMNRRNTGRHANISVENKAVWSEHKVISLTDLGVAWSSHNSLVKPKMIPDRARIKPRTFEVSCVKLDDYIAQHSLKPRLIKIDAESAELEIVKGLTATLRELRPMITLEVGDDPAGTGVRSADAVSYCSTFGYVPFIYREGEIHRHRIQEVYEYDNVFLVPEEQARETLEK